MKLFQDPNTGPIQGAGCRIQDNPQSDIRNPHSLPLAVRIDPSNPNHHLWLNNGTWYIHYTVCPTPVTAERVRRSLKTKDINEARTRRDLILATGGQC